MVRRREIEKAVAAGIAGGRLEEFFRAYFNNKMWLLLMMIEHPEISRKALSIEHRKMFLEDLYHHFLPSKCLSKYRHAFEWLFRFLEAYPQKVTPRRIYQALQMVSLVYEALGLELPPRIEAVRLEREEGMGRRKKNEQEKTSD